MKPTLALINLVVTVAHLYGVQPSLVMGVIEWESGFDPLALGDKDPQGVAHSFGYMQLNDRGAGAGYPPEVLLVEENNIRLGTRYLSYLLKRFKGDEKKAVSAYNQGEGGVEQRGWEFNRTYVEGVLELREKWGALDEVDPYMLKNQF